MLRPSLFLLLGVLSVGPLASGCLLNNAGPTSKLSDAVSAMNKATRWGQLGQAARMVEPAYRPRFVQAHKHWGTRVQVADSEVLQMEMTPDHEQAMSLVAYNWYLADTMTLHSTVVRQRWSEMSGHYGLISEAVVSGDPRLFDLDGKGEGSPAGPETGLDESAALADW